MEPSPRKRKSYSQLLNTGFAFKQRNLGIELGGVIFGCTDSTIEECLRSGIFGLPEHHFCYVKNITTGMPIFLFNYSTRKLHGIFEAVGPGKMDINPHGWTTGFKDTIFPAQVQVTRQVYAEPLPEEVWRPILKPNFYSAKKFNFELEAWQAEELCGLFLQVATLDTGEPVPAGGACFAGGLAVPEVEPPAAVAEAEAAELLESLPLVPMCWCMHHHLQRGGGADAGPAPPGGG
uniref:Beta-kelch repeat type development cell death kelch kelch-type beta n=1 Tax=Tetraselmis sp. GSL018 TaxID=582737 RepID=A0A061S5R2_9CHLO